MLKRFADAGAVHEPGLHHRYIRRAARRSPTRSARWGPSGQAASRPPLGLLSFRGSPWSRPQAVGCATSDPLSSVPRACRQSMGRRQPSGMGFCEGQAQGHPVRCAHAVRHAVSGPAPRRPGWCGGRSGQRLANPPIEGLSVRERDRLGTSEMISRHGGWRCRADRTSSLFQPRHS